MLELRADVVGRRSPDLDPTQDAQEMKIMQQEPPPMMTAKQEAIYHFIRKHIETKGFPPAIRDICDEFGLSSPNGVMCHLKALQKKGYINRVEKRDNQQRAQARGITIPGVSAGGFSSAPL